MDKSVIKMIDLWADSSTSKTFSFKIIYKNGMIVKGNKLPLSKLEIQNGT